MGVFDVVMLVIMIPLLLVILLLWLICIYGTIGTIRLMRHGDPESSMRSQVSSLLQLVACDLVLPYFIGMLALLILQGLGFISDFMQVFTKTWVGLTFLIAVGLSLIVCSAAIILETREYFDAARRKAAETGEGLWIGRHGDG